MEEKMIVTLEELPVLPCAMDYLTYCRYCSTYGLWKRPCYKCGRKDKTSLDEIAARTVQKNLVIRIGVQLIAYAFLYVLSEDFLQLILSTLLTALFIGADVFIYIKYKTELINLELEKHINANIDKIRQDLRVQLRAAIAEVDAGNLKAAYDRLRYLSKLMDNDEVRTFKLICLRNFQLRSDMPLEMNSILQSEYNIYLVDYIYEVSLIKKEVIDEQTILYILENKEKVLEKSKGKQIIASVLEASLRSKYLFTKYVNFMPGYVTYFSADRLLRLCKLSSCIEDKVLRRALLQEARNADDSNDTVKEYVDRLEEA